MFVITGLYMLVPFLKKIAASDFLTKYFLALSFIFAFTLPQIAELIMMFSERWGGVLENFVHEFYMFFVMGYTGYFVLNAVVRYCDILMRNPVAGIPLIAVIVFVISFAISAVLNHIPVLKKYIV